MEFLKDILASRKKYFLVSEISHIHVPMCPELTVERVLSQVKAHPSMLEYLPTISDTGKQYIERDFLFNVVNTIDPNFFRDALAEIEGRRHRKAAAEENSLVEVSDHSFNLLQQC